MKINILYTKLIKATGKKISYADIGKAIGTTRSNVGYLAKKNSEISEERIKEIEKYFNVSLANDKEELTSENISELAKKHGCTVEEYELIMKFLDEEKDLALYAAKTVINKDQKARERFIKLTES